MNKLIDLKLKKLKEFQEIYPSSHVGGSIGLMLRGIDLKRDLSPSDLDITIDEDYNIANEPFLNSSNNNDSDFDFSCKRYNEDGLYVKLDIRINPEPSFDVIEYNENLYNVSKLRDILFWKRKYALKGFKKHGLDLITIQTGNRPSETLPPIQDLYTDLPF